MCFSEETSDLYPDARTSPSCAWGLGLGPCGVGRPAPALVPPPHPSPTQPLASCLPGDVRQERVARVGGWGWCDRSISLCPPLRVTGCLATCLLLARGPGPVTHSPIPEHVLAPAPMQPCSHAAVQTVSVAWKFRSRGCPGKLPDGERCAPAESAPAGSLGEVWRTIRFGCGWVCGERWEGARA